MEYYTFTWRPRNYAYRKENTELPHANTLLHPQFTLLRAYRNMNDRFKMGTSENPAMLAGPSLTYINTRVAEEDSVSNCWNVQLKRISELLKLKPHTFSCILFYSLPRIICLLLSLLFYYSKFRKSSTNILKHARTLTHTQSLPDNVIFIKSLKEIAIQYYV